LIYAVLAGCSSTPPGALSSTTVNITLCLPAPDGAVVADGQDVLMHKRGVPVTLEGVSLVNARGVRVVSPALLPAYAGSPLIGGPWPPSSLKSSFSPVVWRDHVGVHQVLGADVQAVTVVFGVSLLPGSKSGSSTGTRVEYQQNGKREAVTTLTALRLVDHQKC